MTAIVATIIVLGVLIFVHELGHFWAAKAVGIEVQRFSIGLGPRIWGFQRGETEYVLSAIPLGGYVKMGGMEDEMMDKVEGGSGDAPTTDPSRSFDSKPIWARTLVISAGVIMNMLFALVVFIVVAGGWGVSELDTTRVSGVRTELLPAGAEGWAELPGGVVITQVGDRPVSHWGEIREAFLELPAGPVQVQTAEGSLSSSFVLPESPVERVRLWQSLQEWREAEVAALVPGSPAEAGGLQAGDLLLEVDGRPVANWWGFQELIRARPGVRTEVTLERSGQRLVRVVTPDVTTAADPVTGAAVEIGYVGIYPNASTVNVRVPPMEAVVVGSQETWAVTTFILASLRDLVTGQVSPRNLGSIVTIGQASGDAADEGISVFLRFMALFSVNLAILNLLPIPILDGGHLVFLAVEAVRGRALTIEQRVRWSQVGFVIIVGIMVLALSNDVMRLLGI
jgi:regulator of sigma E protease